MRKDFWLWTAVKKHLVSSQSNSKALLKLVSKADPTKSLVFCMRNHEELTTICNDVTARLRTSRKDESKSKLGTAETSDSNLKLESASGGSFNNSSSCLSTGNSFASMAISDESLHEKHKRQRSSTRGNKGCSSSSKANYRSTVGSESSKESFKTSRVFLRFLLIVTFTVIVLVAGALTALQMGHFNGILNRSPFLEEIIVPEYYSSKSGKTKKQGWTKKNDLEERKHCLWTTADGQDCVLSIPLAMK